MSDVTQDQVVDYIKGVSVLELSELVKKLEEELGVTAAAAMPAAVAGAAGATARARSIASLAASRRAPAGHKQKK